MKLKYQCEICGELYNSPKEAINCEGQITEPKYKCGDIVYLRERYPDDSTKPFVKRIVENVWQEGHEWFYGLNLYVEVGKGYCTGFTYNTDEKDKHYYGGASEEHLYLLYDMVWDEDYIEKIQLTLNMVSNL